MRKVIGSACTLFAILGMAFALSCSHGPPVAAQSQALAKAPEVTISADAKGQCYYLITGMPSPKAISCDKLKQCVDKDIDPASDACPSQ